MSLTTPLQITGSLSSSSRDLQTALGLFRDKPIDLVVTDHLLGRQTGAEMAGEMKRTKPSVPIILLSGTSSVPEPLVDADAFLSKTEGPEQLLELVTQLLLERTSESASQIGKRPEAPSRVLLKIASSESSTMTWNKAAERMYGYRSGRNHRPQCIDALAAGSSG